MLNSSTAILILEGGLAVIFFAVMLMLWRKVDTADAALWVLVWATRVFASLNGVEHCPVGSSEMNAYIGLQACSGCTLIVILARSELRLMKERLVRNVMLRLMDGPTPVAATRNNA